jgi:hypothetical protein
MSTTVSRPEYVIAFTPTAGRLAPGVFKAGVIGIQTGETGGEVLARCQSREESYNWLVDKDGKVYELAGWDRASSITDQYYTVGVVQSMAGDTTDEAYASVRWLLRQLANKKGINLFDAPGFSMPRLGL